MAKNCPVLSLFTKQGKHYTLPSRLDISQYPTVLPPPQKNKNYNVNCIRMAKKQQKSVRMCVKLSHHCQSLPKFPSSKQQVPCFVPEGLAVHVEELCFHCYFFSFLYYIFQQKGGFVESIFGLGENPAMYIYWNVSIEILLHHSLSMRAK